MTRYDLFKRAYLASIDNHDWLTYIMLALTILFRLDRTDEDFLNSIELLWRNTATCNGVNYAQANFQFPVCPTRKRFPHMLLKTLTKFLRFAYVNKMFIVFNIIDGINALSLRFRIIMNRISRIEAFPLNLEAVHCDKQYRSQ